MFVFAGARSAYLQRREMEVDFQLQQLAQATTRVTDVLAKVYTFTNPDPNAPANTGPNQLFVAQLQAWEQQLNTTQERLKQERQMIEAEKKGQEKRFSDGVKGFYDLMI
jgi:flagellar hook-associated protein FlgK